MNPIYYESLTTISQKTKAGEISSVEVTKKVLAHIHQRDGLSLHMAWLSSSFCCPLPAQAIPNNDY
jgi:Asp-tRNA(Asn)/Glu-tRNA(Gln) amidotransferase A subunit family amidase